MFMLLKGSVLFTWKGYNIPSIMNSLIEISSGFNRKWQRRNKCIRNCCDRLLLLAMTIEGYQRFTFKDVIIVIQAHEPHPLMLWYFSMVDEPHQLIVIQALTT